MAWDPPDVYRTSSLIDEFGKTHGEGCLTLSWPGASFRIRRIAACEPVKIVYCAPPSLLSAGGSSTLLVDTSSASKTSCRTPSGIGNKRLHRQPSRESSTSVPPRLGMTKRRRWQIERLSPWQRSMQRAPERYGQMDPRPRTVGQAE